MYVAVLPLSRHIFMVAAVGLTYVAVLPLSRHIFMVAAWRDETVVAVGDSRLWRGQILLLYMPFA